MTSSLISFILSHIFGSGVVTIICNHLRESDISALIQVLLLSKDFRKIEYRKPVIRWMLHPMCLYRMDIEVYRMYVWISAVKMGYLETVKWLIEKDGFDSTDSYIYHFAIKQACKNGHTGVVDILLKDPGVDPSYDYNIFLEVACKNGHTGVVDILLKDPRVDPSYEENQPLEVACKNGHTGVVDILLKDPRVDPSYEDHQPLRLAAYSGHLDVIKRLLKDPRVDQNAVNSQMGRIMSLFADRKRKIYKWYLSYFEERKKGLTIYYKYLYLRHGIFDLIEKEIAKYTNICSKCDRLPRLKSGASLDLRSS